MNVVERIQLALKGGREERMLLIRDPNKIVQRGVMQSPRLTDLEVGKLRRYDECFYRSFAYHRGEPRLYESLYGGKKPGEESRRLRWTSRCTCSSG